MAGKNRTSLMSKVKLSKKTSAEQNEGLRLLVESVKNMTRRSMPRPHPPVGARPCSRLGKEGSNGNGNGENREAKVHTSR